MGRKKRKKERPKPFYGLAEVRELVREGRVLCSEQALDGARYSFGWDEPDIRDALLRLEMKHFHKSDVSEFNKWRVFDFYKARGLKGENVYTHFYVDTKVGFLIVNSFKEI
ncbi:MAG: type II toxin-antitoxin system MqsR family toxin [Candidatus Eisenbacteria bacterium]